jgi:hypothetical protein
MSQWSQSGSSQGDALALEAQAARAGLALACAYSNSAEFDAELIAARRAAGVYGPRRYRRRAVTLAGIAAGLAAIVIIVNLIV